MKKSNLNQLCYRLLWVVLLLCGAVMMTALLLLPGGQVLRAICIGGVFVLLGAAVCLEFMMRKRFISFSDKICDSIDSICKEGSTRSFLLEQETLTSKIQLRLKQLYEITNASARQSQEQKETIQQLVSDISHQLKTPIANISMYNDTLLNRKIPWEEQRQFLTAMQAQVEKLDFLIQALVKMSRLENNLIKLNQQPQPIFDTIASALGSIQPSAERKNISITADCDDALILPHDVKWTGEALFNLLENAVKYTPEGGQIAIEVQPNEMFTRITITDNGIGISPEHFNNIFKRFYREPKVQNIQGIGVGLYLTREIITRQGGYMKVSSPAGERETCSGISTAGKGAAFSVFLPNWGG